MWQRLIRWCRCSNTGDLALRRHRYPPAHHLYFTRHRLAAFFLAISKFYTVHYIRHGRSISCYAFRLLFSVWGYCLQQETLFHPGKPKRVTLKKQPRRWHSRMMLAPVSIHWTGSIKATEGRGEGRLGHCSCATPSDVELGLGDGSRMNLTWFPCDGHPDGPGSMKVHEKYFERHEDVADAARLPRMPTPQRRPPPTPIRSPMPTASMGSAKKK